MSKRWIAIISRTDARVFDANDMRKVISMKNGLGREKNRAFTTGKPGVSRSRSLTRNSTHAMDGKKNPHDDAAKAFAKKINEYLKKRFHERRFDELIVSAEPRMQGWVKAGMQKTLLSHTRWRYADLGKLDDHELKLRFAEEL